MSYIVTFTGRKVPLLEPHPDHVDVRDIAHSLAYQCRFTGHTPRFYSVAEHSLRVAWVVQGKYENPQAYTPLRAAKVALLHDAAEAYLGDVSAPLKPLLSEYRKLEDGWQAAIYEALGVTDWQDYWPRAKEADEEMFCREVNWFFEKPGDFGVEQTRWAHKPVGYTAAEAEELMLYQLEKWSSV